MKVHAHCIGEGLFWREGASCSDCGGPVEREASMPPAPPLPCHGGCGLDLSLSSHAENSECEGAPRWRKPFSTPVQESLLRPLAAPHANERPQVRVNGYRWPFAANKANGS